MIVEQLNKETKEKSGNNKLMGWDALLSEDALWVVNVQVRKQHAYDASLAPIPIVVKTFSETPRVFADSAHFFPTETGAEEAEDTARAE